MALIFSRTKEAVEEKEPSFIVVIILASDFSFELTLLCIMRSLNAIDVIILMQNQNQ